MGDGFSLRLRRILRPCLVTSVSVPGVRSWPLEAQHLLAWDLTTEQQNQNKSPSLVWSQTLVTWGWCWLLLTSGAAPAMWQQTRRTTPTTCTRWGGNLWMSHALKTWGWEIQSDTDPGSPGWVRGWHAVGRGGGKRRREGDGEPEHHPHQQTETGEQWTFPPERLGDV